MSENIMNPIDVIEVTEEVKDEIRGIYKEKLLKQMEEKLGL